MLCWGSSRGLPAGQKAERSGYYTTAMARQGRVCLSFGLGESNQTWDSYKKNHNNFNSNRTGLHWCTHTVLLPQHTIVRFCLCLCLSVCVCVSVSVHACVQGGHPGCAFMQHAALEAVDMMLAWWASWSSHSSSLSLSLSLSLSASLSLSLYLFLSLSFSLSALSSWFHSQSQVLHQNRATAGYLYWAWVITTAIYTAGERAQQIVLWHWCLEIIRHCMFLDTEICMSDLFKVHLEMYLLLFLCPIDSLEGVGLGHQTPLLSLLEVWLA